MDIIWTTVIGLFASVVTGVVTFFQTKKKYDAEVNKDLIDNMQESLKFYQTLADDNKVRLDEVKEENAELRAENVELKKQVKELQEEMDKLKVQLQSVLSQICVIEKCDRRTLTPKKKKTSN